MEPAILRYEILRLHGEHEASGTSALLADKTMAAELGVGLRDVQQQLLILESNGLVKVAKMMGPTYDAQLTPKGMQALEAAQQAAPQQRRIGF